MNEDVLFRELDLDGDGKLSRDDIHRAAIHFGWQWPQASIFALLDLMTLRASLEEDDFISNMLKVYQDPDGPYGEVLGMVTHALEMAGSPLANGSGREKPAETGDVRCDAGIDKIIDKLEHVLSREPAEDFKTALKKMNSSRIQVSTSETALLIIDPQRSFTSGSWKESLGSDGDLEVMPIQAAFDNCADLLKAVYHRTDVMFTRCPFPPGSYDWDERFEGIIDPDQFYFIKPGNCVLLPETNGFREWVDGLIGRGKKRLVMGGCTLNSCLRVSSLETLSAFRDKGLEVIVDLSLCGSRSSNYANSPQFGGASAVEAAMKQMSVEGVRVAERVEWI
jgi:nicotinamidase-related amidase